MPPQTDHINLTNTSYTRTANPTTMKLIASLLVASSVDAFTSVSLLPSSSLLARTVPPRLAKLQLQETADTQEVEEVVEESTLPTKKYVVVGGGWGGWGAAKALCESGIENVEVTMIDALPDPTGATPYLSPTGKPVEAGTRGFWKDYPNINALVDELGLDENEVFTPFTNSSFYSPDGLEATAPVFGEATVDSILGGFPFVGEALKNAVSDSLGSDEFPMLPSPLGQVLATVPYFERLPLADRASMVGLLLATIDCLGGDEETKQQYDRMSAHELFIRFKLSERLVSDFIKPTLLVGLFKPPEELSALVVMELLYYYALAHQDSFDVRWIKNGTVSDSLIQPMAEQLMEKENGALQVLGGCRVKEISVEEGADGKSHASKLSYLNTRSGEIEVIDNIDGIVLALGCQGMQSVISSSPDLARLPEFSKAASLKGIDVISCRLYFDRKVATRSPANVFSRFEELRGAGGTFFMLDQFQDESLAQLWGKDGESEEDETLGSVVACDFYNSGGLMSLKDEDIVKILTDELLPSAVSKFADAKLVDSWVGKYSGVVSWFSPGSYALRPPLEGAGNAVLPNVKCAGDWVRMGEREHGAKGLCQERAFVSGFEAANSLMKDTAFGDKFQAHKVLAVREDEMAVKLGMEVNRKVMSFLPRFWTR
mmetsp:Transcript_20324/g.36511  ORF Transcript_20324/g.36511 Transcript_20324/m.36511 type:complete len:657 (-) Transcript_20324:98-2068(-)